MHALHVRTMWCAYGAPSSCDDSVTADHIMCSIFRQLTHPSSPLASPWLSFCNIYTWHILMELHAHTHTRTSRQNIFALRTAEPHNNKRANFLAAGSLVVNWQPLVCMRSHIPYPNNVYIYLPYVYVDGCAWRVYGIYIYNTYAHGPISMRPIIIINSVMCRAQLCLRLCEWERAHASVRPNVYAVRVCMSMSERVYVVPFAYRTHLLLLQRARPSIVWIVVNETSDELPLRI